MVKERVFARSKDNLKKKKKEEEVFSTNNAATIECPYVKRRRRRKKGRGGDKGGWAGFRTYTFHQNQFKTNHKPKCEIQNQKIPTR